MSLKKVEDPLVAESYYSMRDKAFTYVRQRIMDAYDKADENRKSIDSKEKFTEYQERVKGVLDKIWGNIPYDKSLPLNARCTGEIQEDELTIKKIIFESRKNVYVTANLYVPCARKEKCPAVLLQCGHSENGKGSVGYQRAARIIALAGCIVLVTDPPGQGERNEYIGEDGMPIVKAAVPNHQQFGTQCFFMGEKSVKYFLADAMRAVDYLCSLDEVDATRIGATGISGGGTMTTLLMVMDERIKAAAPGCWPCSGREYFLVGTSPDTEQIWPEILIYEIDHFEIMACMCPRPLLFLAAEYDFIPIEGTRRLYEQTKYFYELMGSKDLVEICIAEESHGYAEKMARQAAEFFAKNLAQEKHQSEKKVKTLADAQLQCTKSGQVKKDFPDSLFVFDENLEEYKSYLQNAMTKEERKACLEQCVYRDRDKTPKFVFKKRKESYAAYYEDGLWIQPYFWYTQDAMPCYGILIKEAHNREKDLPITICLWSDGTNNLCSNADTIRSICQKDRAVFVVDLIAMGKCKPYKLKGETDELEFISSVTDKIAKGLSLVGDSLCAIRAYDLMQTIKMIKAQMHIDDIELYTKGNYCVYGRITELLDESVKTIFADEVSVADLITHRYYNTYDLAHLVMPGIGKYLL